MQAVSDTQRHPTKPTRPGLLRKDDAAAYLGISTRTLDRMDVRHEGPARIEFGRARLYDVADLEAWLSAHRVNGNGHGR